MDYTRLGSSGLEVSRITLGCMSFGGGGEGMAGKWSLEWDDALPLFGQAVELGITFWDTANAYSAGRSEELVGRAVKEVTSREQVVIATKLFFPVGEATGPGSKGLSRRTVMQQVDDSLRRLDTDFIDLYQIHRFDPDTPVEETMEALHDVVKAGKVRYLGASSMWAWQLAKMQHAAEMNGWTPFVSMQDQYSLLQREEEREMFGLLADQGMGSIPWSPLARGYLARPWGEQTHRSENDPAAEALSNPDNEAVVDAVAKVAEQHDCSMAQVALAWVLRHPLVDAPIVGATKEHHLADAVGALEVDLTDDDVAALEEHYTPREPTGFS